MKTSRWLRAAAVVAGGAAGTGLRILAVETIPSAGFPWATLTVNLLGAAALGFLLPRFLHHAAGPWSLLIGVGLLGALTTFSTLIAEFDTLIRGGRGGIAVAYLATSVIGGLVVARTGMVLGGVHR